MYDSIEDEFPQEQNNRNNDSGFYLYVPVHVAHNNELLENIGGKDFLDEYQEAYLYLKKKNKSKDRKTLINKVTMDFAVKIASKGIGRASLHGTFEIKHLPDVLNNIIDRVEAAAYAGFSTYN